MHKLKYKRTLAFLLALLLAVSLLTASAMPETIPADPAASAVSSEPDPETQELTEALSDASSVPAPDDTEPAEGSDPIEAPEETDTEPEWGETEPDDSSVPEPEEETAESERPVEEPVDPVEDPVTSELQARIDALPDPDTFDAASADRQEAFYEQASELEEIYFQSLDDSQRAEVDASRIFSTCLMQESTAYEDRRDIAALDFDPNITKSDAAAQVAQLPELDTIVTASAPEEDLTYSPDVVNLTDAEQDDLYLEVAEALDTVNQATAYDSGARVPGGIANLADLIGFFTTGTSMLSSGGNVGETTSTETKITWAGSTSYLTRATIYANSDLYYGIDESLSKTLICADKTHHSANAKGSTLYFQSAWEISSTDIRKIMYYGYQGPGQLDGWGGDEGFIRTHQALSYAYVPNAASYSWVATDSYATLTAQPDVPDGFHVYMLSPENASYFQPYAFWVMERTGTLKVNKSCDSRYTAAVQTFSDRYALSGAVYTVYFDSSCTLPVGTIRTNSKGTGSIVLNAGNYYLKETTAPKGYTLDSTVRLISVGAGETTTVNVSDVPDMIRLSLTKRSDHPTLSATYSTYSLSGAVYTISDTDGDPLTVITTDDTGKGTSAFIPRLSSYTVQETRSSNGFLAANAGKAAAFSVPDGTKAGATLDISGLIPTLVKEPAQYCYIRLTKTDADNGTLLPNAVYGVYSDSACTNLLSTITTNRNGTGRSAALPAYAVFYVKELTAPDGYTLSSTVYRVYPFRTTAAQNGSTAYLGYTGRRNTLAVRVQSETGYVRYRAALWTNAGGQDDIEWIDLTAANASGSYTHGGTFRLEGHENGLGSAVTVRIFGYDSAGKSTRLFTLNETLPEPGTSFSLTVEDHPNSGELMLKKESGNSGMTDGNNCYSLEGAVYGIYTSKSNAVSDTNRVDTLITAEDGGSNSVALAPGTYYVKEQTASPGYGLCDGLYYDGADSKGIHTVKITQGRTAVVTCVEPPLDDPFSLVLTKEDMETGSAQGISSLQGAIFELRYWGNTEGDTSDTPLKTWYFTTDEDGYIDCVNANYLLPEHTFSDDNSIPDLAGVHIESDTLYLNPDNMVIYPIGTYVIREISPPKYYQLSGSIGFKDSNAPKVNVTEGVKAVLAQDENHNVIYKEGSELIDVSNAAGIGALDYVYEGSVSIAKTADNAAPLEGVTFRLVNTAGEEFLQTTGEDGIATFTGLAPDEYTLTEIHSADGNSLLADSVPITLPVHMTAEEAEARGADLTKAATFDEATGEYCFYDLDYSVSNHATWNMPFTGSTPNLLPTILGGSLLLLAAVSVALLKEKRKQA